MNQLRVRSMSFLRNKVVKTELLKKQSCENYSVISTGFFVNQKWSEMVWR